ncbi:N-glycosylase/DNA lyase [Entomortierella parvispora]|uniref:N-glycosylase/DNA lyase n=1 Tax=Entomortierella parvispora TaxID=205924 RepID=A0A9P3HAP4_9FUNG|nr:N-glycosylase/DNA lyase [Entomortierella parvispora]
MAAVAVSTVTRITRKRVASAMTAVASSSSSTSTRAKSAATSSATKRILATDKSGSSTRRKAPKDDTLKKTKSSSAASSSKSTPHMTAVAPAASIPQPSAEPFIKATPWTSLTIPRSELDLSTTLKCGQSFRWHREHVELPSGEISLPIYSCVLDHRLWCIQETEDGFKYRTFRPTSEAPPQKGWSPLPPTLVSPYFAEPGNPGNSASETQGSTAAGAAEESKDLIQAMDEDRKFLEDYLQLHVPLTDLYEKWSETDQNFKAKAPFFPGVRILRQDPMENLICFICSSNNNIARISQMATKLCQEYGTPINVPTSALSALDNDQPATTAAGIRTFYGFPTLEALAQEGVEEKLRGLGFGYRAKYIARTAQMIYSMENGLDWLFNLRQLPYQEAHDALLTLQGVGPKVADCVCLMSLDKQDVIPVDTHVWQIAVRDYKFRFEGKVPKTISLPVYKAVSRHFFERFGEYSGWAHTVLFAADLRVIEGRVISGSDLAIKVKLEEEDQSVVAEVIKTEILQLKTELGSDQGLAANLLQREDSQEGVGSTVETLPSHRRQSKRIKT